MFLSAQGLIDVLVNENTRNPNMHVLQQSASENWHFNSDTDSSLFVFWLLWHINLYRLFNAKSIFIDINSSILNNSV